MREFQIVKSGTGYAVAEIMDCDGKGMGPERNWRMVGPGCPTIEKAETLLVFWETRVSQMDMDQAEPTYMMRVMDKLHAEGMSAILTPAEVDLVQLGLDRLDNSKRTIPAPRGSGAGAHTMTNHPNRPAYRIIAKCEHVNGKKYQQVCATPDVARSCMKAFRDDPTVKLAMAYYTDDRGAFDTYTAEAV